MLRPGLLKSVGPNGPLILSILFVKSSSSYAINGLRSRFPEMARIIRYNIGKCLPHLISITGPASSFSVMIAMEIFIVFIINHHLPLHMHYFPSVRQCGVDVSGIPLTLTPIQHPTLLPSSTTETLPTAPQTNAHTNIAPTNVQLMVTRSKASISRPIDKLTLYTTTTLLIPKSHIHAFHGLNWQKAMLEEYIALFTNDAWVLVPHLANVNIDCSMWLFRHKFHADGSLSSEFAMIDLGSLNYFLGISAQRSTFGKFLSQSKFAEEILERAHMQHCHLSQTPDDTESKLGSDGDPAGCPVTCSAEAEYHGVANVVAETAWIRNLLRELHAPLLTATLVYYDNISVVYMSANPVQHQRTKHRD
ncbi:ribonuclease H-like domain-containing protein [Tanacetum coccineum]